MEQASFSGVLRTVLIMILTWWAVKAVLRIAKAVKRPAAEEHRATGEMRIEKIDPDRRSNVSKPSKVDDVDFEEIH